jgi:hypothetical protein
MRGKKVEVDLIAVMERLGAPDRPSFAVVAAEFGIPESTLRSKNAKLEHVPDNIERRLKWLREQIEHLGYIAERLAADIEAEREYREKERAK